MQQQTSFGSMEFGHADLGDRRRTWRTVALVDAMAMRPAGTVTGVYGPGAEREAAYRLLENVHIDPLALERSRNIACARRMEESGGLVVVAVDQTSIKLSDRVAERDFGAVGSRTSGARGVHVMTALALDKEGAPLGILNQKVFARSEIRGPGRIPDHPNRKSKRDRRPPEERESMVWPKVLYEADAVAAEHTSTAVPWFQCDRGGDFWGTFRFAEETAALVTVRMNCSHAIKDREERQWQLGPWLKHRRIKHFASLQLPAHDGRPARTARITIRFDQALLALPTPEGRQWTPVSVVHVHEKRPKDTLSRISWTLATTYQVDTPEDAARVVENYSLRWRVEDFFRAWKTGACNIESSQIQSFDAFHRWSILSSSVAARAEHIKHHSRLYPEASARVVYSREEIETMILWRQAHAPKAQPAFELGDDIPLAEMTRCVAQLGGYMKSRNSAPPGTVTIMRGLEYLANLVEGRRLARAEAKRRSG
jgi:hypothetical protein